MLSDQLSPEALARYIDTRHTIDEKLDFMVIMTNLLSQYRDCSGDEVIVELYALGAVNTMLNQRLHEIGAALEAFMPLLEAKAVVEAQSVD